MRLFALFIALAFPVMAQTPGDAAQVAADRLEAAQQRMAEARSSRDRVAALTETVQSYEAGLAALRESLRLVSARTADAQAALERNRADTAALLAVLQTISRTPAPVQMVHPVGPLGAIRAGTIVADMTPALRQQAAQLAADHAELARLQDLQRAAITMLTDGLHGAQTARAALGLAISQRVDPPRRFVDDPIQTALLLASADTLAAFADQLAVGRPDAETVLTAGGDLRMPVPGTTTEVDGRPGVAVLAEPRALVTTPVPATILFRGPLLDYGNVVILEPVADVLFVFAGLAEVFGEPGEILGAGAPVGLLGGAQPGVDSILNQIAGNVAGDNRQALYLEVRNGQSPVDPGLWFALD